VKGSDGGEGSEKRQWQREPVSEGEKKDKRGCSPMKQCWQRKELSQIFHLDLLLYFYVLKILIFAYLWVLNSIIYDFIF